VRAEDQEKVTWERSANTGLGRLAKRLKDKEAKPPASEAVQLLPRSSSFAGTPPRVEVHSGPQVIDLDVK
jgi:hypothetical protein